MSYVYYTKFHINQKVVPKLNPESGAIGVVIEIAIINEHTNNYMIAWNNGINKWATVYEITPYKRKDGVKEY